MTFGVLISGAVGSPVATHVPFAVLSHEEGRLTLGTHMARANPHSQTLDGARVLAIFQGPHAYVSPRWYADPAKSVPTWNYVAVHCSGIARRAAEDRTAAILEATVRRMEGERGWSIAQADPGYIESMKSAIAAFEIDVDTIEGARKLSQNRSEEDRARVSGALLASPRSGDRETGAAMQRETKNG